MKRLNLGSLRNPILNVLAAVLCLSGPSLGEIRLPAVLGSHMVLQQGKAIQVWGWAVPGETVTVSFAGQTASATVDKLGKWAVELSALHAGPEVYSMTISGTSSPQRRLEDILIGEVWLCSGQSNMEWPLVRIHSPSPEIQRAHFPRIRLFQVARKYATRPLEEVEAEWKLCQPDTARDFSAVAYYFGRELLDRLDMPVGLIHSSWGGTRIEPWTPPEGFQAIAELNHILDEIDQAETEYRTALSAYLPELNSWIDKTEAAMSSGESLSEQPEGPRHGLAGPQEPTALYNGMVHPLIRFAIRGVIWYQGESNRNDCLGYRAKMEALIRGWRQVWKIGDFPFYYVQLAPYNYPYNREETGGDIPDFLRLPLIWEAQMETLKVWNTGMVVITDIANLYDIHPRNKQEVGRRLALWARAFPYGEENLTYSGPLYRSYEIEGDRVRIHFAHTGTGLAALDEGPLTWFEIAGEDRVFYKAHAEIDGDTVLVWSPRVSSPAAVRFGWHQLAVPNLANKEGLPASPFRTDRW